MAITSRCKNVSVGCGKVVNKYAMRIGLERTVPKLASKSSAAKRLLQFSVVQPRRSRGENGCLVIDTLVTS